MPQNYSPNESLERIYRALAGFSAPDSVVGTLGQQSFNESLSRIAHLLEGVESEDIVIPGTVARYGGMYADNVTGTVIIGAPNTFYMVTGSLSQGSLSGFTFSGNHLLTCGFAGKYVITYSLSVYSASANQEIETTIMVNGVGREELSAHAEGISVNVSRCLAGSAVIELAVGDTVAFGVSNHTGANNLMVQHATLSVVYISS